VNGQTHDPRRTVQAVKLLKRLGGLGAVLALVAREVLDEQSPFRLDYGVAVGGSGSASARIAKGLVNVVAGCEGRGGDEEQNSIPHQN
jgi:hypothetical protein